MTKKVKHKSEKQAKAEATIAARTVLEQAKITLANQTKNEVKALETAIADLQRVREVVKANKTRHFDLLGEPEKKYPGFGPKKPYKATGLVAEARDDLDKAITEGRGSAQKQRILDDLIAEARTLTEWLDKRSEKIAKDADAKIAQARMSLMHKAQSVFRKLFEEINARADKGEAIKFSCYADGESIKQHFAAQIPNWQQPEPHPFHTANFVASLYPHRDLLDMFSKMVKLGPTLRARAKHIFEANSRNARIDAQAASDRIYDGNLNRSISMKVRIFKDNNPGADFRSAQMKRNIEDIRAGAKMAYIDKYPRPVITHAPKIEEEKPAKPKTTLTHFDIRKRVMDEQREMYLAAGLTEKGLPINEKN